MHLITSAENPAPHGHYSHAVVHGGFVFVSGVLGGPLRDGEDAGIEAQARRCLDQIERILRATNAELSQVVKLNVYVRDTAFWSAANVACAERFGAHRPARVIVPVGELRLGSLIEMDAIAAVNA